MAELENSLSYLPSVHMGVARVRHTNGAEVICFFRKELISDPAWMRLQGDECIDVELFPHADNVEARTISGAARALIRNYYDIFFSGKNLYLAEWGNDGALAYEASVFLLGAGVMVKGIALFAQPGELVNDPFISLPISVDIFCTHPSWLNKCVEFWSEAVCSQNIVSKLLLTDWDAADAFAKFIFFRTPAACVSYGDLQSGHMTLIQTGRSNDAPYFCIPGAGASVIDFIPFASIVSAESGVYAFQPPGLSDNKIPYSTVEYAAQKYLEELKAALGHQECNLVGHSFGGWVAFEMACRLQREGIQVRSLTILDSRVPGENGFLGGDHTRLEALMLLIDLYEQNLNDSLSISMSELEALNPSTQLDRLHQQLVKVGLMSSRTSPQMLARVVVAFETALRTDYRPKYIFEDRANLVLAKQSGRRSRDVNLLHSAFMDWRAFAPQLKVMMVDANHVTLLKKPAIEVAASAFM